MRSDDGTDVKSDFALPDAPAIAFDRIVIACLEMEWQILPRVAQRVGKAVRELDEDKSD